MPRWYIVQAPAFELWAEGPTQAVQMYMHLLRHPEFSQLPRVGIMTDRYLFRAVSDTLTETREQLLGVSMYLPPSDPLTPLDLMVIEANYRSLSWYVTQVQRTVDHVRVRPQHGEKIAQRISPRAFQARQPERDLEDSP